MPDAKATTPNSHPQPQVEGPKALHDADLETKVLAAALLHPEAVPVVAGLDPACWYTDKGSNRVLAERISAAHHEGWPVSVDTLAADLKRLRITLWTEADLVTLQAHAAYLPDLAHLADRLTLLARNREVHRIGKRLATGNIADEDLQRIADLATRGHHATAEDPTVPAARWMYADDANTPMLWGRDDEVLLASDESLFIVSPPGVGKTTLATLLLRGLLGLEDRVLGYPIHEVHRVLYLAMDRPAQIRRAMRRRFTTNEIAELGDRFIVRPGPIPADLGRSPELLAELARKHSANVVVIDSVKDACSKLTDDEAGGNFNRSVQACLAEGVAVIALHHQRKGQNGQKPNSLEDVYGSTWITAGAGSVVLLWGETGAGSAELIHLKPPATPVGPLSIELNTSTGAMLVTKGWDALAWLTHRGPNGGTVTDAARAMKGGEPTKNDRDRTRRKLDGLVSRGVAEKDDGQRGGGGGSLGATYRAISERSEEDR